MPSTFASLAEQGSSSTWSLPVLNKDQIPPGFSWPHAPVWLQTGAPWEQLLAIWKRFPARGPSTLPALEGWRLGMGDDADLGCRGGHGCAFLKLGPPSPGSVPDGLIPHLGPALGLVWGERRLFLRGAW